MNIVTLQGVVESKVSELSDERLEKYMSFMLPKTITTEMNYIKEDIQNTLSTYDAIIIQNTYDHCIEILERC